MTSWYSLHVTVIAQQRSCVITPMPSGACQGKFALKSARGKKCLRLLKKTILIDRMRKSFYARSPNTVGIVTNNF